MRKHVTVLTTAYYGKNAVDEHLWKSFRSKKETYIKTRKHVLELMGAIRRIQLSNGRTTRGYIVTSSVYNILY